MVRPPMPSVCWIAMMGWFLWLAAVPVWPADAKPVSSRERSSLVKKSAGTADQVSSERIQAMQEALMRAQPKLLIVPVSVGLFSTYAFDPPPGSRSAVSQPMSTAGAKPSAQKPRDRRPLEPSPDLLARWISALLAVAAGLAALFRLRRRREVRAAQQASDEAIGPIPPSTRIIDHLVWRAFERQGYESVHINELNEPLGVMRIVVKDGRRAALICVGEGVFFEKTTIEACVRSMREAQAEEGFLVSTGAFTVPAQRYAKEHQLTLLGRDQFAELLSEGAMTEHYATQLQQFQTQLSEAKDAVKEYAQQLDAIRRQRNEASWYLGEERARSAARQAEVERLSQEGHQRQQEADQVRQSAERLKKQWEESQWYLGEARASAQHFETQMRSLQGELETARQLLTDSEQRFDQELGRRERLEAELTALPAYGERRRAFRVHRSDASIEVHRPDGCAVFSGIPRDISSTGFGFEFHESPADLPEALRVRLRLPGLERELETGGRLVWHRAAGGDHGYIGGCTFLDLAAGDREAVERVLGGTEGDNGHARAA